MTARTAAKPAETMDISIEEDTNVVFSRRRTIQAPTIARLKLPKALKPNTRLRMDGLKFLSMLPEGVIPVAFFDPQYRGLLDKLQYGNEGEQRGRRRCSLEQMAPDTIASFVRGIDRVLLSSGHLFLWMDKYHLCTGFQEWLAGTSLEVVDMVTWDKKRMGMGYRTRCSSEHLVVLQKAPRKAKGVWKVHTIRDIWSESVGKGNGVHPKPVGLQAELIAAVSDAGDVVIDPAAGSFSVLEACRKQGRRFLGCDINGG